MSDGDKLANDLAYWRDRAAWTDAQFLADYCAEKRREAQGQAAMIEAGMAASKAVKDEIRRTGSEEG